MSFESTQLLLTEAAQTVTGAGAAVDLGTRDRLLRQTLAVSTAVGTTPTLDVRLEASADGVAGWRTFATFARASAVAVERITAVSPERYVRVAWTIAGTTPSFTIGVTGTRGIVYANLDDLDTHGMPSAALASIAATKRADALSAASDTADGKLAVAYDLPLSAWGVDLTAAVCKIAAYELLSVRGFNPDGADQNVRTRYEDALRWLDQVAAGRAVPVGIVDATPAETDDGATTFIATASLRGW